MEASNKSLFSFLFKMRGERFSCCMLPVGSIPITHYHAFGTQNTELQCYWGYLRDNFHHRRTCLHAYVLASAHVPVSELICSLESSLKIPPSSVMWLIATLRLRLSSSEGCDARQDHMLVTKRNASVMNAKILTLSNQHQFILMCTSQGRWGKQK